MEKEEEKIETIETTEENLENNFDYDFLKENQKEIPSDDLVSSQFDRAFNQSSPVIQNYLLSDKLQENIKLICKIEKLDDEKSQIIVENVAVSILVGLLPINEAKETLIESFKSSGIIIESFTAGMLLKNIDAYILSDIRKQILESKIEKKTEIRHLTLKEQREESEKEELRKILLERTGIASGKGDVLIQYKEREKPIKTVIEKEGEEEEKKEEIKINRESLLAKINLHNVSDSEKIRERMLQIKKEEEERIKKLEFKKDEEAERIAKIKEKEEEIKRKKELEEKEISLAVVEDLKEKLSAHEDEMVDLNELRKQREKEEIELQKSKKPNYYEEALRDENEETDEYIENQNFDPYRESF